LAFVEITFLSNQYLLGRNSFFQIKSSYFIMLYVLGCFVI
jgi:hypothetical protein